MRTHSPFGKGITELAIEDLAALRGVQEGWYVEYKREAVPPKSLAKEIAAFANTHGGWLFLGVEESQRPEATASGFPGLDANETMQAVQRLHGSVNAHLSPVPYFDEKVLQGPDGDLGLAEGRSIVVVYVPASNNAPHIHTDGCIYLRVAEDSQPQPLTDRHLLEELWRRGETRRSEIRDWVDDDPDFLPSESWHPFVRIMLSPDLRGEKSRKPPLTLDVVRSALRERLDELLYITFQSVYPTSGGWIARSIKGNDPNQYNLTLHLYDDLSCDLIVPLNLYVGDKEDLSLQLDQKYEHGHYYTDLLQDQGYWRNDDLVEISVVDLNSLLYTILGFMARYKLLLRTADIAGPLSYKAKVLHCSRRTVFVDSDGILERFSTFGVPLLMHDEVIMPPGRDISTFLRVPGVDEDKDSAANSGSFAIWQGIQMWSRLVQAFGMGDIIEPEGTIENTLLQELISAGWRSVNIDANNAQGTE